MNVTPLTKFMFRFSNLQFLIMNFLIWVNWRFFIYTFVDCLVIFANHNFDKICPPPPQKKEIVVMTMKNSYQCLVEVLILGFKKGNVFKCFFGGSFYFRGYFCGLLSAVWFGFYFLYGKVINKSKIEHWSLEWLKIFILCWNV